MKVDNHKKAFESGWEENPHDVEDLDTYPRWGVAGREGLVLIDVDNSEMEAIVRTIIPETFECRSPRRGLPHFYLRVRGGNVPNRVMVLRESDPDGSGEIRAQNHYLVAPSSEIEYQDLATGETKKGRYTITRDIPIAPMRYDDFIEKFKIVLKKNGDRLTPDDFKGVATGRRHDRAIRIATYLISYLGLTPDEAYEELDKWDQKNQPPINDPEYLKRTIRRAMGYAEAHAENNPTTSTENIPNKKHRNYISEALQSLSKFTFKTPDDIEELYIYRDGQYLEGETFVKGFIEKMFEDDTNGGMVGEIIGHLKRRSYVPRETFNQYEGEIPVKNGLLNLTNGMLNDFSPDKIFTFKINATYNPDKRSEKWDTFLTQILPDEMDRLTIQEYAGYTLLPSMPYHKIAFLVGNGRNGKGSFIRTINRILGISNVSNIRIDVLNGGHRFAATNLYGKLMNVSSEPSVRFPLSTELLKQLTGDDWFDGEVKGKQNTVKFQPTVKHYVQANKLPKVNDTSDGWWDRVIYIRFPMKFTEDNGKQIVKIEETWLNNEDDKSGILNWLIEGLLRLTTNGKFTKSKTQREAMIQFKRASDPLAAFLIEECEYNPEYFVERETFFSAYKDYAKSLNVTPEGNRVFFDRLRDQPGIALDKKKRIRGKAERVVLGVRVKEHTDEDNLDDFTDEESESEADEADEAHILYGEKKKTDNKEGGIKEKGVERCASSASSASPPEASVPSVSSVSSVEEKLKDDVSDTKESTFLPDSSLESEKKAENIKNHGEGQENINLHATEEVAPIAEDNDPPVERQPLDVEDSKIGDLFAACHGAASSDYLASKLKLTDEAAMFRLKMLKQRGWVSFDLVSGIWRWVP